MQCIISFYYYLFRNEGICYYVKPTNNQINISGDLIFSDLADDNYHI